MRDWAARGDRECGGAARGRRQVATNNFLGVLSKKKKKMVYIIYALF